MTASTATAEDIEKASERIHVYLAKRGLGSRREIEGWITAGYIKINGKPAKLGQKIVATEDEISIRGRPVRMERSPAKSVVVALHKPRGVITTVKDPEGRETVMSLVPKSPRLFPIGRLDLQSEGLLLLTNDGELAERLTHPRYAIPKIYDVKIRGNLDAKKMAYLEKGVRTPDEKYQGAQILNIREATVEGVDKFQVRIKIFEGKNQEIRKIFDAIRCRVIRLKRVQIGPITIRGIPHGEYRILPPGVVNHLKKEVGL